METHVSNGHRGKVVFVDGLSTLHMKGALGIDLFDFKRLYDLLCCKVGTCNCLACAPIVTMHPEYMHGDGLGKILAGAGFQVVAVDSRRSADDNEIIERIDHLDPDKVGEIVIMSTDKDYVPVLRAKATNGISVHWVATTRRDPRHNAGCLSEDVIELCRSGVFHFFALDPYARQITQRVRLALDDHMGHHAIEDTSLSVVRVTFHNKDGREHRRLGDALRRLELEFKGLKIDVEH